MAENSLQFLLKPPSQMFDWVLNMPLRPQYLSFQKQSSGGKQVFLEISQNSHENTCAIDSFLIKLQTLGRTPFFTEHLWWLSFTERGFKKHFKEMSHYLSFLVFPTFYQHFFSLCCLILQLSNKMFQRLSCAYQSSINLSVSENLAFLLAILITCELM